MKAYSWKVGPLFDAKSLTIVNGINLCVCVFRDGKRIYSSIRKKKAWTPTQRKTESRIYIAAKPSYF